MADGSSATAQLEKLSEQLRIAENRVHAGQPLGANQLGGLVRWMTDWIPNINDPLVAALGRVERAAR